LYASAQFAVRRLTQPTSLSIVIDPPQRQIAMRKSRSLAFLLLLTTSAVAAQSPGWQQAERAIRSDYARREATTKILEISKGEQMLLPFWVAYEAQVNIERAGGRHDTERVGVSYWLVSSKWELEGVELLGHRVLADVKPPATEAAQKLLAAAWAPDKCEGFDITQVKLEGEPRFQRTAETDPSKELRSYIYSVEVMATGNGKFRMSERGTAYSNSTQNLLTWDADKKSWWVDPRQVRCGGWIKQEASQAGAAAPASSASATPATMSNADTPPDADAITLFKQAWTTLRPDFTISSVALKSKEPHKYQERRWITYKLSIIATGTEQGSKSMAGKKYLCEPDDFSSVLKWDADAKQWKVDESMIKNFNESSCTPKS
jgi:hypothetical protein